MKDELQNMLDECSEELDDIEQRITNMKVMDKGRLYLTNYALIKACGTLEFIYRSIVADYFMQLSDKRIDTYLELTIRSGSNSATYDNMMRILGKFDSAWRDNFKNTVQERKDGQKLINASNSLVNNRHNFAHGKSPTATFLDIKNYYQDVVELINIFDGVVQ